MNGFLRDGVFASRGDIASERSFGFFLALSAEKGVVDEAGDMSWV
jgi:hypothetical protein